MGSEGAPSSGRSVFVSAVMMAVPSPPLRGAVFPRGGGPAECHPGLDVPFRARMAVGVRPARRERDIRFAHPGSFISESPREEPIALADCHETESWLVRAETVAYNVKLVLNIALPVLAIPRAEP